MTGDPRLEELAHRTPNFGFLLGHEAVLVGYGAAAESMVFTDPNTSMIKARQFGEQLVTALVTTFGIRIPADEDTQYKRLKVLLDQGVINKRVHSWFDAVRDTGNKAVHEGFAAQRDALRLVRTCYDLGAWFHRTATQSRQAPPFVPPQPPQRAAPPRDHADAVALTELNDQLGSYRAELVEMRLRLDEQASSAAAEAQARREAETEILAAVRGQGDLHRLVSELSTRVEELGGDLARRAEAPPRLDPARRDALVEQAQIASRPPLSEVQVRRVIDRMLAQAGWVVQDVATTDLQVAIGVAVREVSMARGRADYLLYVDGALVGVIEAKREGVSVIGAEQQSDRYAAGLTTGQQLAAWRTPLPFRYESTGVETRFTNGLDPVPRSRRVFAFHQPTTIARWMREAEANPEAPTLRARLRRMPELITYGLRPNQVEAITGLEQSLAADRPRALIQMATGAGKTYTVVNASYRLLKHAGARRVLFLVDRNNLGKQARAEYSRFETPDDLSKFSELYNVQRLTSTTLLESAGVVISTVQRLYAMLRGQEPPEDADPDFDDYTINEAVELEYNATVPPETFDLIVVDECHRSIYGTWRAVLEYFDAHLVGLTATPVAQTFGFFHENLVSQYTYRQAVADGVNVDFDIMRIHTQVGEHGGSIPADTPVRVMDLHTRRERYEQLDTALDYRGEQIVTLEGHLSAINAGITSLRAARRKAALLASCELDETFHTFASGRLVRIREVLREPLRNGYSGRTTADDRGVRVITLTAVTKNQFIEKYTKLCETGGRDVSDLWLEQGDILIQRANTSELVGTAAIYLADPNWSIFPDPLIRVRVNNEILPEFLAAALVTNRMREYFKSSAKGLAGTMPKIDQSIVENATLFLPSLDMQREVINRIHEIDRIAMELDAGLEFAERQAERLRVSLISDGFFGRLVPQDPNDEPASVLLERIKVERATQPKIGRARRAPKKLDREQESLL
ncbi:MAG: DEAD/DEAH box helicase family protein [Pseudonocardiales bacterium]|nr:DEAD/DEAH box helicase family protein [Pseudonocardiales bacterium]MBV9029047.1 DEAD/DEAH box helicase family protein [Pseudonocardiales bacterium]